MSTSTALDTTNDNEKRDSVNEDGDNLTLNKADEPVDENTDSRENSNEKELKNGSDDQLNKTPRSLEDIESQSTSSLFFNITYLGRHL